ncbi:MAG: FCD domain-containing protein [Nitriliruptorales bacterium]|nr:FCD domain-containing protein [Nitriliruptorales bacterium]
MADNSGSSVDAEEIFRPVTTGRASSEVVRQIKAAILDGRLKPGDRLSSERELTEHLGVSRVTVRDGLRMLEAAGLIEIKVGARGGAFVRAPAPDHVGEGLANMLMLSSIEPAEVTEARMIFEIGIIPLVCDRATDEDIAALSEICERSDRALSSGQFDVSLSAEFHTRLAHCTHNPAIGLIVESFQGPLLMSLMHAKAIAPQMGDPGVAEHWGLVRAIEARDVERARHVMVRHLGRTASRLRERTREDALIQPDGAV